ncbi:MULTISPECIES: Stp1/IreP family PP2C-type Ser/Thr phosphatase [unclassified Adlercreutzia]|uniref:Stp1/IreP family PP2C-type Ser/Thr phosphatase n=1 Tax=unclassified Adlercreutzia TaxID=2636013 RepID=UPI0013EA9126|nr:MULTISPECIES: Stp1/IreP family PP2C-type Ser/Thr phosphatase [unclassified Adlercreutzia]
MSRRARKGSATFGSRTDVGCVREHNEDSLVVTPPLYVVCDGMGGHAAGEVASEIAVDVIAKRAPAYPDATALGQAVEEANLAVIRGAQEGVGRAGMGCTCTAAMLENERLVIAQVGDSRAYLLHQGRLQQLTRDHSFVADLVESGQITPAEARVHPQRSVITRALGSDPRTQPDLFEINVETGDRLLLCSDGLSSMIEDDEIEDVLNRTTDPQLAASQLVNAAIAAGGYDNVTVIVVNVTGFAEVRRKKVARKTKVTAALLVALLAAIIGGAAYAFNFWTSHAAYLAEQDGKVAIYQGVPGTVLGMDFSELVEVTDVPIDELQPGVANRIKDGGLRTDSLKDAQELVEDYRADIKTREDQEKEAAAAASSARAAASSSSSAAAGANGASSAAGAAGAANPAAANPAASGDAA